MHTDIRAGSAREMSTNSAAAAGSMQRRDAGNEPHKADVDLEVVCKILRFPLETSCWKLIHDCSGSSESIGIQISHGI